jgi:hypothetical protein
MTDAQRVIPVYLVALAPQPGASTHRQRGGGGGVCIVGIDPGREGLMIETVLHESIHALDVSTDKQETVLNLLRSALREAGHTPRSATLRDVPHTLIFVQAGETVRRLIDPAHKHYGDVAGYYAKVPEEVAAVREPWTMFLDGRLGRQEAIREICARSPPP